MRVIAGKFKSRLIHSPKGVGLRPTSDRVKESLFGILGAFVIDKVVLDLFSGTGNLGIEALSRGTKSCVFVDNNPRYVATIKKNLELLGIGIKNAARSVTAPYIPYCSGGLNLRYRLCRGRSVPAKAGNGPVQVLLKDAFRYIKEANAKGITFDLIFLDPPYYKDMIRKSLILLDNYNIITQSSVIAAEHHKRDELPQAEELKNLKLYRQEKYGGTFLSFYERRLTQIKKETQINADKK